MKRYVWVSLLCACVCVCRLYADSAEVSPNVAPSQVAQQAAFYGFLNVFTDLDQAIIEVDGEAVSRESLVKYPLSVGEHLVQVRLDGKLVYQEKSVIQSNRTSTVVSDHFVDIITQTPSRGAIDREARRLRASRGDLGLGFLVATLPQPAASMKLWLTRNLGIQAYALGSIPDSKYGGVLAGRALFSPGDKVFASDVTHAYVFLGGGRHVDRGGLGGNNYAECGIGVEAKLGELANTVFGWKYKVVSVSSEKSSDITDVMKDVATLAVLNVFYTSGEINMMARGATIETGVALGFHVYF